MVKHNNRIPRNHFHKHWNPNAAQKGYIMTFFDQPAQKKRRRVTRQKKAELIAPRPVSGPLRPVVHCPTARYNLRVRLGRGFTLEECRKAGLAPSKAKQIGVAVDHRRTNHCEESLALNVQRLKTYLSKLLLYPIKAGKINKGINAFPGDASREDLQNVTQDKSRYGAAVPRPTDAAPATQEAPRALTDLEKKWKVYEFMRKNRRQERIIGYLVKRKARKEAKEKKGQ